MVDPNSMLTAAKAGYDAAKKAIDIADRLGDVELKAAILELKEKLLEKGEENFALRQKLSDIENKEKIKESAIFEKNVYWVKEEGSNKGPFCPSCLPKDDKLILMTDHAGAHNSRFWSCPVCKLKEFYKAPEAVRMRRIRSSL